jgi:hypothetical protein
VRRFIAVKHSKERRKTQHDYAVMGAWYFLPILQILWQHDD